MNNLLTVIVMSALIGTLLGAPLLDSPPSSIASRPAAVEPVPARGPLDRWAIRAAIEAHGYESVDVLGRGTDGSWRAKAYRGQTEVRLVVDGMGRVSAQ